MVFKKLLKGVATPFFFFMILHISTFCAAVKCPPEVLAIDQQEINEASTLDEVKRKYRNLALKYHTDRGGDADDFDIIKKTYEDRLHAITIGLAREGAQQRGKEFCTHVIFNNGALKYAFTPEQCLEFNTLDSEEDVALFKAKIIKIVEAELPAFLEKQKAEEESERVFLERKASKIHVVLLNGEEHDLYPEETFSFNLHGVQREFTPATYNAWKAEQDANKIHVILPNGDEHDLASYEFFFLTINGIKHEFTPTEYNAWQAEREANMVEIPLSNGKKEMCFSDEEISFVHLDGTKSIITAGEYQKYLADEEAKMIEVVDFDGKKERVYQAGKVIHTFSDDSTREFTPTEYNEWKAYQDAHMIEVTYLDGKKEMFIPDERIQVNLADGTKKSMSVPEFREWRIAEDVDNSMASAYKLVMPTVKIIDPNGRPQYIPQNHKYIIKNADGEVIRTFDSPMAYNIDYNKNKAKQKVDDLRLKQILYPLIIGFFGVFGYKGRCEKIYEDKIALILNDKELSKKEKDEKIQLLTKNKYRPSKKGVLLMLAAAASCPLVHILCSRSIAKTKAEHGI